MREFWIKLRRWSSGRGQHHFVEGLFFWLCLTNATQIMQLYIYEGKSLSSVEMMLLLGEGALRVAGLSLVLALICSFLPRILRLCIAALSGLLFLVDIFSLLHYHSVLDAGLLQVILATNPSEALEYLVTQGRDILPLLAAAGIFLLLGGWYWRTRTSRLTKISQPAADLSTLSDPADRPFFASSGRKVCASLLTCLFAASCGHALANPEDSLAKLPANLSVGRLAMNLRQSYDETRSTAYVDYALASQPVEILSDRHDIPKVVFILGESTSRHHMQLYGYDLPTTPNLVRREQAGELTVFSDVTSPHAGTMAVMRTLFSFYDKDAAGRWYDYGNLFDEASRQIRAEYDNAVLYDDDIVDQIIRRFAEQDAVVIFLSDHGEEVNDVREIVGHGDESSRWQHEIPMVIWTSAKFRAHHPEDAARIGQAKDRRWCSDEMIHTLLDLMKIEVPQYEKEKSLLL